MLRTLSRNRVSFLTAVLLLAVSTGGVLLTWAAPPPISESPSWKRVQEAVNQGLPKTALKELGPLIDQALAAENHDGAVRGIAMRVVLQGNIQGNQPAERVVRMEAEIKRAPDEIKPVLEAILAHWYWNYFQQNRWRFANRTQVDSPDQDDNDFTTWDLNRILAEIDRHFLLALRAAPELKEIAASDYNELLQKGSSSDAYRPTLYDVIAESAIAFYAAGEHGGSHAKDTFILQADSPIFDEQDRFLAWAPEAPTPKAQPPEAKNLETNDERSLTLAAITLYQDLLRFHADDSDPASRLDWDLARLRFGLNQATHQGQVASPEKGPSKGQRYQKSMRRFADRHANHPISARALHELATQFQEAGELAEAHKVATQGLALHPESVGGRRCYNLIEQIESKVADIQTERVWNDPWPVIDVTYRNVRKVFFRLVRFDHVKFLKSDRYRPSQLGQHERERIIAQDPVRSWSVDLEPTNDFQQHHHSADVPRDLPLGSYLLLSSHQEDFGEEDNKISITEVWRSDLALVIRNHHSHENPTDGFVLNAKSGQPIENAKVEVWQRGQDNRLKLAETLATDPRGQFEIPTRVRRQIQLFVKHHDDALGSMHRLGQGHGGRQRAMDQSRTVFFTDRSLYRPGQTIQYKGVCYWAGQEQNDYRTLGGQGVTVIFTDVNGQEIERRTHRSNDYGSFAGSVTAPRDRLMGQMRLQITSGPRGETAIAVEEYKRPNFRVEMKSPQKPAKLGDQVTVTGTATAYTGVAIDGAKVAYRVVRQVQYAPWWRWRCWWMPVSPAAAQEIANGTTTTDGQGQFQIEFTARPDASVATESEPTFTFEVHADVTDTTGETRSDQTSIPLRYSAIAATLSVKDFLTTDEPIELSVKISGLFGDDQKATGTVKVHRLKQPERVARRSLGSRHHLGQRRGRALHANEPQEPDASNPDSWELGEVVAELPFETTSLGQAKPSIPLEPGRYRAVLTVSDGNGNQATAYARLQVIDRDAKTFSTKIPFFLATPSPSVQPGETFQAVWGSGYDTARVHVEVIHRDQRLQAFWTELGQTQGVIEIPIKESMRGGVTLRTTMVRENRIYQRNQQVMVPWTNKKLDIRWERFVSKLQPAAQETWTAIIQSSGDDPELAVAEMVATLYDASLDAFKVHSFPNLDRIFRRNHSHLSSMFENQMQSMDVLVHNWRTNHRDGNLTYWHFPAELTHRMGGYGHFRNRMMKGAQMDAMPAPAMMMESEGMMKTMSAASSMGGMEAGQGTGGGAAQTPPAPPKPQLDHVVARKNLNETAFFFPQLVSGKDGTIKFSFTMPEALTQWNFLGFAHDQSLRSGTLRGTTVTAKDLMVQPNPPRFVREGDQIEFTVKVSNQSPTIQTGTVRLSFADARTGDSVDSQLGNSDSDQAFTIPAGQSESFSWRIHVADGLGFLTYKAVGSTGRLSDGEEGYLPVLSRRVLVTESLPLPIRGKQSKDFEFTKLLASGNSDSLEHQSLTVQMVSNPSWYAVMALPYLMEYPHECSEQTFNRFYANSLARHIVTSDPKIARVFEQWRSTPALESPLEKNQDIKSVMIAESPWQRQAKAESQARRDVGVLFDQNRLDAEMQRAIRKLTQMQRPDGSWPWFDGGPSNPYLTLYITTGFGRLQHLGVAVDTGPATKSLTHLDQWADTVYRRIKVADRKVNHLGTTMALYLYGRSFFIKDHPVADQHREALNYWLGQADEFWLDLNARQSQAQLAVALHRWGNIPKAKSIIASLKERSVVDEELGMFWRELEASWWWYRAPIETQAMMIEAFDEVMNDQQAVEDCKVWMLKQKQTQAWKTTKATADAIYAMLLRGTDLLASDALVQVALGDQTIEPTDVEAGTGFYQERILGNSVEPAMGKITLTKVDEGVSWGSLHWQYLEDLSKVTPHNDTPLQLTKQLYVKKNTPSGPKLVRVAGPIEVGDELVVRIVLETDRAMEFVHLKDHRGSGTEPVNVLSRYRSQDGLWYYESTRDTASHFFIDYLPKGKYVFEYSTRVQLRGEYQSGFAHIESMYAPEFGAHSESLPIIVK